MSEIDGEWQVVEFRGQYEIHGEDSGRVIAAEMRYADAMLVCELVNDLDDAKTELALWKHACDVANQEITAANARADVAEAALDKACEQCGDMNHRENVLNGSPVKSGVWFVESPTAIKDFFLAAAREALCAKP